MGVVAAGGAARLAGLATVVLHDAGDQQAPPDAPATGKAAESASRKTRSRTRPLVQAIAT